MKKFTYVLKSKQNGGEFYSFTFVKADKVLKQSKTKFLFDDVEIEFDEDTEIYTVNENKED